MAIDRHTPTSGPMTGSAYGTAVDEEVAALWKRVPVTLGSVAGTNTITASASPVLTGTDTYVAGMAFWLTPANTITGAATLNIDSQGAVSLADRDGNALAAGQLIGGRRHLVYYDGSVFRVLAGLAEAMLFKYLAADDTGGQNVNTAQPWFPTSGQVTLAAGVYRFRGQLHLSRAAGTTSHTTSLLFGGTAVLTSIDYLARAMTGDANTLVAMSAVRATAATATAVKAASTSATEQAIFEVEGIVIVGTGGTLIPQFIYSAAPGGAPTVKRGSFLELTKLPDAAVASAGAWA